MHDLRDQFLRIQDQLAPRFVWMLLGLAGTLVPLVVLLSFASEGWMFMHWHRLAFMALFGLIGLGHASLALFTLLRDARLVRVVRVAMNPLLGLIIVLGATSVFLLSMVR